MIMQVNGTVQSYSGDATASFSGYLYQADIALLRALGKIKEIGDDENELKKWSLEVEGEEDFSLLKDEKYVEFYQVKEYKHTEFSKYKEAIEKLFINISKNVDSIGFLCTYLEITDGRSNSPEYSNEKLLKKTFESDDITILKDKLLKFNCKDILGDNKGQKVFGDYLDIESKINMKIGEITNIDDPNKIAYIREYITIQIKKYIQNKAKHKKAETIPPKEEKYLSFINDEPGNPFPKGIFSLLKKAKEDPGSIIDQFLQDKEFILGVIKNIIERRIQNSEIRYIDYDEEFIQEEVFINTINNIKGILSQIINNSDEFQVETLIKIIQIETNSYKDLFNKIKTRDLTFLNYSYQVSLLINEKSLKRFIVNLVFYTIDISSLDGKIHDILSFKTRIILGEETEKIHGLVSNLIRYNFIQKFENKDIHISSHKITPQLFSDFDQNSIDKIEKTFDGNLYKDYLKNNITKYKGVKLCCFRCPYNNKLEKLQDEQCGTTGCELYKS